MEGLDPNPKGQTLNPKSQKGQTPNPKIQTPNPEEGGESQTPNPKGGPLGLDLHHVQVAKWFKVWGNSLYA